MKNNKTIIFLIIFAFFVGWFIGWMSNNNSWIAFSTDKEYGVWEIVYYISAIIAAFGTVGAVFVALFKERIVRLFTSPNLILSINDDNCFCEEVDSEQQNPTSSQYQCLLSIINKGNAAASGCEICISNIRYKKNKDRNFKDITDYESKHKLFWESSKVDIPVDITKQAWLFKIDKPNSYGTPSSSSGQNERPHLQLNGIKLKDSFSEKGIWEVSYYINNCETGHTLFKITVEWNGEWKTRKTEMVEVLKVNFEIL